MNLLDFLGIGSAHAAAATTAVNHAGPHATPAGGFLSMLPMLVIFIAVFYFLLVRPQSKRAKEQKALMDQLTVGDEVVTNAGIVGRLVRLRDNYIVLNLGKDIEMTLQKSVVSMVLPKGTIDSIQ